MNYLSVYIKISTICAMVVKLWLFSFYFFLLKFQKKELVWNDRKTKFTKKTKIKFWFRFLSFSVWNDPYCMTPDHKNVNKIFKNETFLKNDYTILSTKLSYLVHNVFYYYLFSRFPHNKRHHVRKMT